MAVVKAFAKVNLNLLVLGRARDGYHQLQSLVAFADLHDTISFNDDESDGLKPSREGAGTARSLMDSNENLQDGILQKLMKILPDDLAIPPLAIDLVKEIPIGAGLGGGSADCAAMINYLAKEYGGDEAVWHKIAYQLGADVSVCRYGKPCWMYGRGDEIVPINSFPSLPCLIVYPRLPLSTAAVFAYHNAPVTPAGKSEDKLNNGLYSPPLDFDADKLFYFLQHDKRAGCNDLRDSAIAILPQLAETYKLLRGLPDIAYTNMSGSGSAFFVLYHEHHQQSCYDAAEFMQAQGHAVWVSQLQGI